MTVVGGFSRLMRTGDGAVTGAQAPIVREGWRYKCPECSSIRVRRIRKNRHNWKCWNCEATFEEPVDGGTTL